MEKRFNYGGQAVIDGVMMRGRRVVVTAVRGPGGGIALDTQSLPSRMPRRSRDSHKGHHGHNGHDHHGNDGHEGGNQGGGCYISPCTHHT